MEDEEEEPPLAVQINDIVNHVASEPPSQPPVTDDPPPVGVTVITGYLGAGKSTVITHL